MKRLELNIQLFAASATITNARQGNYNVENNNEIQVLTFTVKRTSGTTYWQDNKNLTFRLTYNNDDGTTTTLTQTIQFNFPSGSVGATKSASVYFTVPHKSDGTQNISYEASISTGTSVGTLHPTGSATLETIPRASSITVNDANIGSSTTININRASKDFTTTLRYRALGENGWTNWIDIVSNWNESSYGWQVPTSLYSLIPNYPAIKCEIEATTFSSGTQVGSPTYTQATFTATGSPIINNIIAEDINSGAISLTGDSSKMIRYASNVRITIYGNAQNSAVISSIKVNGVEAPNGQITFVSCPTNSFEIIVTDSRGYTTTQTITMTMVDYTILTLNATIVRNQPTDGIVNISYYGNYFNGSFGVQNNDLYVQYRSIEKGGSWDNVQWINLTPTISGNTYSQSNFQISGYNYQKQYEFQIRAFDQIRTAPINGIIISKGEPIYWWDDDGLYVRDNLQTKSIITQNDRLSSPNFDHQYPKDKISERLDISSASMDSSGYKPINDGFIKTFFWDNSGAYDSQIYIPNSMPSHLQIRTRENGNWLNNWKDIAYLSDVPTNNNQLINGAGYITSADVLKETVLYNDSTGSNSTITLSDSAANYTYLEIYFKSDNDIYNSAKIYSPNGKKLSLTTSEKWNFFEIYSSVVNISGTSITVDRAGTGNVGSSSSSSTTNRIYITRVVGIK